MSLYLGSTPITPLYLGSTKIDSGYMYSDISHQLYRVYRSTRTPYLRFSFSDGSFDPHSLNWPSSSTWTQISVSPNVWEFRYAGSSSGYIKHSWDNVFFNKFASGTQTVTVIRGDLYGVDDVTNLFRGCTDLVSFANNIRVGEPTQIGRTLEMSRMFSYSGLTYAPALDIKGPMDGYVNVASLYEGSNDIAGGLTDAYYLYSARGYGHNDYTFNCASNSASGTAERANIPESWGGTLVESEELG